MKFLTPINNNCVREFFVPHISKGNFYPLFIVKLFVKVTSENPFSIVNELRRDNFFTQKQSLKKSACLDVMRGVELRAWLVQSAPVSHDGVWWLLQSQS